MIRFIKIALVISISILLFSCNSKPNIKGYFIKVKGDERGTSLNAFDMTLVDKITFGEKTCQYSYLGIMMSGEYIIDKNYVYINAGGLLGTLSMEIIDEQTLEGKGLAFGTFKKK
ncbi:MAG: hypothetical protein ACRCZY_02975 [Phocaeicola sp.]